ncbi:sensor histidine kinase [Phenylobacterium sp. J367]|uniref:sensor histidine kinase n=1 Tax=Phenylobacterium sp. J367 TaxID=2898435 RepID=UPI002151CC80|nr:histidine kinase [Phenylobacterium sp. J367]MCR5878379.1 histidine kinase [Phenylobacterium sp. J367]
MTSELAAAPAGRRWTLRLDRYLAANVLVWLVTYALMTVRSISDATFPYFWDMALRRLIVCGIAVGICILIQRALFAARPWPMRRRLLLAAGLAILGGAAWGVVNHLAFYVIDPVVVWKGSTGDIALGQFMNFTVMIWSFIAFIAVVFVLDYDQEVREKTLRLVQAQAMAAESQNQMLRYQINPHFLFNTLNALSSLILARDYVRAEQVVLSLSRFLRASLERPAGERNTLDGEIEAQRQYLAIEQIRFGDRLRFEARVPADLAQALVPSLILQPLVENAVKYGVARSTAPVTIEIAAERVDGRLHLWVCDDARGDLEGHPPKLGVGLENVRRRLEVMYPGSGRLTVGPRPGGGFMARVELPFEGAAAERAA